MPFFNFFKKKSNKKDLCDFVAKRHKSEYMFLDMVRDLGAAIDNGAAENWPPLIFMAYGYARRDAVAALYVQGVVEKEVYEYVQFIFQSIQLQTGHTVEFQEEASDIAVDFMKTYNPNITKTLIVVLIDKARKDIVFQRASDTSLINASLALGFK